MLLEKKEFKTKFLNERPIYLENLRKEILGAFPPIPNYQTTPVGQMFCKIFNPNLLPTVIEVSEADKEIFARYALDENLNAEIGGVNYPEMDLSVIFRDTKMEDLNGKEIHRNALQAHEIAHAIWYGKDTYFKSNFESYNQNYLNISRGFGQLKGAQKGWFMEEGWAGLMSGFSIDYAYDQDNNILHRNPYESGRQIFLGAKDDHSKEIKLPFKYWIYSSENQLGLLPEAIPGYTLELLCNNIDGLFEKICKARIDSKGYFEVLRVVDQRFPGLSKLLNRPHKEINFNSDLNTLWVTISFIQAKGGDQIVRGGTYFVNNIEEQRSEIS